MFIKGVFKRSQGERESRGGSDVERQPRNEL
jgi:hypothetical protein